MLAFHDRGRIRGAAEAVSRRLGGPVGAAAILGSGFTALAELLADTERLAFTDVDGLPACTAPGHAGEILAGRLGGVRWLFFSGRLHLYEGRSAAEVATPVALAKELGADRVVLTCAAGATTGAIAPGSLVLVEDHLNLTGENPLLAVPVATRSPAFLPMADAYDREALAMVERLAAKGGPDHARNPNDLNTSFRTAIDRPGGGASSGIRRGVLASLAGPCYETPAEYRALARLGADVVSMSCVLETIAARALGMKVLSLALVANGPASLGGGGGEAETEGVLGVAGDGVRARLPFLAEVLTAFGRL